MTGASCRAAAEVRRRTEAVQEQPLAVHQGIIVEILHCYLFDYVLTI